MKMRYVEISGKKYTEKDEILCIFDNTNQLNSLKKDVRYAGERYYGCPIKMERATKSDASIYIDDYMRVWDFREGMEDQLIKSWYKSKYPNDIDIDNINDETTFSVLMLWVEHKRNTSYVIGGMVSEIARSRIMERLQEIYHLSDDDLYYLKHRIVIE